MVRKRSSKVPGKLIFSANVVEGAGRGKKMGVPTLNLAINNVPGELKEGIYACRVVIGKERFAGALHYGPRPMFDDSIACEVHLIDTALTETPKQLTMHVVEKIRDISNFSNINELVTQIHNDIENTRRILNSPLSILNS